MDEPALREALITDAFLFTENGFYRNCVDNEVPESVFLYQMVLWLLIFFFLKCLLFSPLFNLVDSLPPTLERQAAFK